jgi:hypothetical protein
VPANTVRFFAPGRGDFLLQEDGVRAGKRTVEVDLDFLIGKTVVEIRSGTQIVFETGTRPEPGLFVNVESEPVCADGDRGPLHLPSLVGRTVVSASARDGVLLLAFAGGATVRCGPDPHYEAWHVEGGQPHPLIVCCPGGELAVWDETPPIPFAQLRECDPATAAALDEMCEQYNLPRPSGFPPPDKTPSYLSRFLRRGS